MIDTQTSKLTALRKQGWFSDRNKNVHVIVDGQFGSTGKGLAAGLIAELFHKSIQFVTTNAAPNSGHTAYYLGEKIVNKQMPVASTVIGKIRGIQNTAVTHINGGACIDIPTLLNEININDTVYVSPVAAIIRDADLVADAETVKNIASTGKGTGPAIARKILRQDYSIARDHVAELVNHDSNARHVMVAEPEVIRYNELQTLVEVSQGFSLGINSEFYPNVTSRECTVTQALADARLAPQRLNKVLACYRTLPIRVGNTENSSGGCYPDQYEIKWSDINQKPEMTTVTGRVRRLFTWSWQQFMESLAVNRPDVIFINFMNYLEELDMVSRAKITDHDNVEEFKKRIRSTIDATIGGKGRVILWGYGPNSHDIQVDDLWN